MLASLTLEGAYQELMGNEMDHNNLSEQNDTISSTKKSVKLSTKAHVICGWPLILVTIGGAIGGGLGGLAYGINLTIFKSQLSTPAKVYLNMATGLSAFGIWLVIAFGIQSKIDNDDGNFNAVLMQTADELNRQLPYMVDEETRLDTTPGYNMEFSYYFTLFNYSSNEIDKDAFYTQMRPSLVNQVCTSSELESFVNNGVTIRYVYSDTEGREIAQISISPSNCDDL